MRSSHRRATCEESSGDIRFNAEIPSSRATPWDTVSNAARGRKCVFHFVVVENRVFFRIPMRTHMSVFFLNPLRFSARMNVLQCTFLATQILYLAFAYGHAIGTQRLTRRRAFVSVALDHPVVARVTKACTFVGGTALMLQWRNAETLVAIVLSYLTVHFRISRYPLTHGVCASLTFLSYVFIAYRHQARGYPTWCSPSSHSEWCRRALDCTF